MKNLSNLVDDNKTEYYDVIENNNKQENIKTMNNNNTNTNDEIKFCSTIKNDNKQAKTKE